MQFGDEIFYSIELPCNRGEYRHRGILPTSGDWTAQYCKEYTANFMFFWLCVSIESCKDNQTVTLPILSIFRQPLHVSGVSRPIIRRYNRMYTTIGTYYSFLDDWLLSWLDWNPIQPGQQTEWGKLRTISVREADDMVKIQTGTLPNAIQIITATRNYSKLLLLIKRAIQFTERQVVIHRSTQTS